MTSRLHELENNEAVLLMYLAGELSAEDRAEVEQMLATDGGLRAALLGLQSLQGEVFAGLATLDRASRPAGGDRGARQVGRDVARWHLERQQRPARAAPPRRPLRIPGWAYPAAVAAALLVGFVTWVILTNPATPSGRPGLATTNGPHHGAHSAPPGDGGVRPLAGGDALAKGRDEHREERHDETWHDEAKPDELKEVEEQIAALNHEQGEDAVASLRHGEDDPANLFGPDLEEPR